MAASPACGVSREQLDEVVEALKIFLSRKDIRTLNIRAVQAKAWHLVPEIAAHLTTLRHDEEIARKEIMKKISHQVFSFHDHTLDATLARAGLLVVDRVHAGSNLSNNPTFESFCLDSKERLYLILKQNGKEIVFDAVFRKWLN
jgi:hypothetical protein